VERRRGIDQGVIQSGADQHAPIFQKQFGVNEMKRPMNFDAHMAAINAAFPIGQSFTTSEAGDALLNADLVPSKDPATAVVYASQSLRHLMTVQDDCPESDQLKRVNRRYVFASPSADDDDRDEITREIDAHDDDCEGCDLCV
jgi:hypothetical protein